MSEFFAWSINLGRWSGTQVRVHPLLVLFVILELLDASFSKDQSVAETAGWLTLLLGALAVHELGHALMGARLGLEQEEVRLWPLGNLTGPTASVVARPAEMRLVILAGPTLNLLVAALTYVGLRFVPAYQVLYPFGNGINGGAPLLADGKPAAAFSAVWCIGWFGYLNWVLFLANALIPALPMDCGRLLRTYKDSPFCLYTAHVCAAVLGLGGLFRVLWDNRPGGWNLIALAIFIEMMVRAEARLLEEGGYFDDGVFGYDFSQGYTSLEASSKVRPYRESALKRWRRRRSELRRQRLEAKEAAEAQRMDEILAKLYREGRSALTDEENRFLIRVSAKYRNRMKARG
ncbi:MAG: hypothetical protein IRY99_20555 [Isosphaeraceae bacterium]|nr:hypothetical protein [Isosphaeraceae bacterium]